ncbi:MAG: hydrogenase small subunit [Candidatus Marinimicrobia bacterium]|nr:hydrogenase small subunit [Candidatus Neomarinimicrobiota bacterium]
MEEKHLNDLISSDLAERMELFGVSRRSFLKFATAITATLGLPFAMVNKVIAATNTRTPVIWLHFQECTGCTESLLRATHPTVDSLVLETISLDYSETLLAAAGHQAEKCMADSVKANDGKFILVVEGSIPTKDNGIYCKVAGKTAQETLKEVAPHALACVAIGSCASWGGVQSASAPGYDGSPTGAKGLAEVLHNDLKINKPVVNLPGCPASPYNILSTILYFLTLGKLPELDSKGRPMFAYGRLIHDHCERRPHFDAGRFAEQFGHETHRLGYCLYKLGCKGPETYANCPTQQYGDVGAWPVGIGHPCFGCSEEGVGFHKPLHQQADVLSVTPPQTFSDIAEKKDNGIGAGAAAVVGALAGAAVATGAMMSKKIDEAPVEKE